MEQPLRAARGAAQDAIAGEQMFAGLKACSTLLISLTPSLTLTKIARLARPL